jgi:hypothetical protein
MQTKQKFLDKVHLPRNPNGAGSIILPWEEGTITVDADQIIYAITGNESIVKSIGEKKAGKSNVLLKTKGNGYDLMWFECNIAAFNLSFRLAKAGYCVDYFQIAKQMPEPKLEKPVEKPREPHRFSPYDI